MNSMRLKRLEKERILSKYCDLNKSRCRRRHRRRRPRRRLWTR